MAYSAARLTCYALLSSLEQDLRIIATPIAENRDLASLVGEDQAKEVHVRAARDGVAGDHATSTAEYLPYIDFGPLTELMRRGNTRIDLRPADVRSRNHQAVTALIPIRNRVAHSRPLDIEDLPRVVDTAKLLVAEEPAFFASLSETLDKIQQEPAHVLGLDIRFPNVPQRSEPRHNLPIPDFDETGYVGRGALINSIHRKLLGAYPVISLVGDGGIGKTAAALRVAYDILDRPDRPYDAIVWTTAKTTLLTTSEIKRIENAIVDSLGLLTSVAVELGGDSTGSDPVGEVLDYMRHFRILLILDNLETVLDETLRQFLEELPNGSKVLLTSRIGVGAFENPVRISPLDASESSRLLRMLAKSRGVQSLASLPNEKVNLLAERMKHHPLYIKWFVSAVQAGQRPEQVLNQGDLLLEFCMSNVYDFLTENARLVLRSMQVLHGLHTHADLAYLNDLPIEDLQEAILMLLTTNFVSTSSDFVGTAMTTRYELSELAQLYLESKHPVSQEERDWLIDRHNFLYQYGEQVSAHSQANPYDAMSLDIRDHGDFAVAPKLIDSLSFLQSGEHALALPSALEAQELAPDYYEAYRVEAQVRAAMLNVVAAATSFTRALELAPTSAQLRYFYGLFLRDTAHDSERALQSFQEAARLDDSALSVAIEISRTHEMRGAWADCRSVSLTIVMKRGAPALDRQFAMRFYTDAAARQIAAAVEQRRWSEAVEVLEEVARDAADAPSVAIDNWSRDRLHHILHFAIVCREQCAHQYYEKVANLSAIQLEEVLGISDHTSLRLFGIVVKVSEKGFGFLRSVGSPDDVYFHARDVRPRDQFDLLVQGSELSYQRGTDARGRPSAQNVRVM